MFSTAVRWGILCDALECIHYCTVVGASIQVVMIPQDGVGVEHPITVSSSQVVDKILHIVSSHLGRGKGKTVVVTTHLFVSFCMCERSTETGPAH